MNGTAVQFPDLSSSTHKQNGFLSHIIDEDKALTSDEENASPVGSPDLRRLSRDDRRRSSGKTFANSPRLRRLRGSMPHVFVDENDDGAEPITQVREPPALNHPRRPDDPLFDPWCDPENPIEVTLEDISAAAYMLKGGIACTPCTYSHMSPMTGMDIYFKKDLFQFTGSFKERGARHFLLRLKPHQRKTGVIACSAGNHALALSYHGRQLGVPVTVIMPKFAPLMKVTMCKTYGANIVSYGDNIAEAKEYALRMGHEQHLTYVNGYDHPWILAGQGTCGLEILEQVPDLDAVIVPVGGGGYIAGIAVAIKSLKPHVQVIGVESEKSAGFTHAMEMGKPEFTETGSSLADGLSVPVVGFNSFATAAPLIDKMIVVKEEFIALAILRLVEMEKVVVEGAGAIGLAAVLSGQLPELVGKKVVIPLSGGNIDTTVLGRCLERGLAADGRLCRFRVVITDRPGGMAELTKIIGQMNVSLKDIFHERAWLQYDIFSVAVTCVVETRDRENAKELEKALKEKYKEVNFYEDIPQ